MRHALFNTTFVGTDAGSLPQSASHEGTKDTIEMLLQTVPDIQSPLIQTPYTGDLDPSKRPKASPVHGSPKEDG